jgi:hypothetical protein
MPFLRVIHFEKNRILLKISRPDDEQSKLCPDLISDSNHLLTDPYKAHTNCLFNPMKKIDILNFITSFRKAPNDIKTHGELVAHLGSDEATLNQMLTELQQTRVIKETQKNGEKAYQVVHK